MGDQYYAGKWVLVTGAGIPGRIGAAIAEHLAERGANIYLHDITSSPGLDAVATTIRAHGTEVRVITGDLTKHEVVAWLFEDSTPDIVINNAGIFRAVPTTEDMSLADYMAAHATTLDLNVAVNMKSAYLVTLAAVHSMRHLNKEGVIVFEGDAFIERSGSYPQNLAAYTASKAYIPSVVHQFAEQYGRDGIRFLGVLNGTIEPPATAPEETILHMQREIPLPARLLNPWLGAKSVAEAIDNLIRIQTVNGTTLTVDGGRTWTTKAEF